MKGISTHRRFSLESCLVKSGVPKVVDVDPMGSISPLIEVIIMVILLFYFVISPLST